MVKLIIDVEKLKRMEEYDTYDTSILEITPAIEEGDIIFGFENGQYQYRIKSEDVENMIKFLRKS